MLKVELHTHTSDDPVDYIPHSVDGLVDQASELGYDAIAITLHERQLALEPYRDYARSRGVVLIPGIEQSIEGRHTLLLNFPAAAAEAVQTFEDLAVLRARYDGLVIAPHPYFPVPSCLQRELDRYPDLFDAVELHALYTRHLDFNKRAIAWARAHGKPLVGNGDIHRLSQLDTTWSLVDASADPDAICAAIRAGRVEVRTQPVSVSRLLCVLATVMPSGILHRLGFGRGG
jgi:hypothetical protein